MWCPKAIYIYNQFLQPVSFLSEQQQNFHLKYKKVHPFSFKKYLIKGKKFINWFWVYITPKMNSKFCVINSECFDSGMGINNFDTANIRTVWIFLVLTHLPLEATTFILRIVLYFYQKNVPFQNKTRLKYKTCACENGWKIVKKQQKIRML